MITTYTAQVIAAAIAKSIRQTSIVTVRVGDPSAAVEAVKALTQDVDFCDLEDSVDVWGTKDGNEFRLDIRTA